jgi:hypothetical protein
VLRSEILTLTLGVEEKIAYGIPFFYYNGPLCYLAPKKMGVDLGFYRGQQLNDSKPFLNSEDRKQVASLYYSTLQNVDLEVLRMVLIEAIELNKTIRSKKR